MYLSEEVDTHNLSMLGAPSSTIQKFDLKTRKTEKYLEGVSAFVVSFNGEKALYRQGNRWAITALAAPPKPGEGTLKTDALEIRVDPKAEWAQMYREVWRHGAGLLLRSRLSRSEPGNGGQDGTSLFWPRWPIVPTSRICSTRCSAN